VKIKRGSTSVRRLIFIANSSSTIGAGLTGLLHNTSGLVAYYFAGDLSNEVQITLAAGTLGSWTSGGFVEVDATNMPGWYEVGIPDAALDGGNEVAIQYRGAANMVPVNIYIELDAVDYQSATNFGLSKFADIEADTVDIQSRILDSAGVRASIGMAAADMDAQLDAILAASGGDEVIVAPLVQTDSQRNTPAYIECNQYDVSTLGPFRVETAAGAQFNFANQTDWIIVVWDKDDNELGVVAYADIVFSSSTSDAVMDQYSFAPSAAQVATAGRHTFSIRRPTEPLNALSRPLEYVPT